MAKTKEELNQLKTEYKSLTTKLQELTDDELETVTGGEENNAIYHEIYCPECGYIFSRTALVGAFSTFTFLGADTDCPSCKNRVIPSSRYVVEQ